MSRVPVLLFALAAVACGPSIDPALKSAVDARIAGFPRSTRTFPAAAFAARPFAAGQFATYLMKNEDGEPSLLTQKVLEANGTQVLLETTNEGYRAKSATQIRLDIPNRMDVHSVRILSVRMKDQNGNIVEQPPQMLQLMRGLYEPMFAGMLVQVSTGAAEGVDVPAGRFEGAAKGHAKVTMFGRTMEGDSWSHSAVPISACVRSVSGGTVQELVEFGDTGATASF